jgi:hypothetical protein
MTSGRDIASVTAPGSGVNDRQHRGQNEYFRLKKLMFCAQQFLNYGAIKGNSINYCDFLFKFTISVRGGHCDYSPQMPKTQLHH